MTDPDVHVPDAAVEAGARAMHPCDLPNCIEMPMWRSNARAALEAARPHLAEALKPVVVDRAALEEIIATKVMRYECAADVRAVDDNEPEALDAGVNALLAALYPKATEGKS